VLFHSTEFLLVFLPVVFIGWLALLISKRARLGLAWLTICSLVFYSYWNPPYFFLLTGSILFNYTLGGVVEQTAKYSQRCRRNFLAFGITANLCLLAYFKYANFFVDTINSLFSQGWTFEKVLLPLAISFFTFQQIAYLVDAYRNKVRGHSFWEYAFFVSFFPQLIAGPIVHHSEVLPQVQKIKTSLGEIVFNVLVGASIFSLGIFKKVVLADSCGELATPFFEASTEGLSFATSETWAGVLAYSFQIYFDFSGYSDMAIGLARIFGIRLPENFASPYRATNIIDFWRRWHITLSRFLKEYLYIPLGGNRRGVAVRYRNLLITMLLGGLWHGAGWTFVVWGGLHGVYLICNHWWDFMSSKINSRFPITCISAALGWALTMFAVLIAWVFFRSDSISTALQILQNMLPGTANEVESAARLGNFFTGYLLWPWLLTLTGISLLLPTTQEYFRNYQPVLEHCEKKRPLLFFVSWRPNLIHGIIVGLCWFMVIRKFSNLSPTEFLYFNF
jgi:alginate O-acetyltransferase complex protein AlgI